MFTERWSQQNLIQMMVTKNFSDEVMFIIKHGGQPGEEREGKSVAGRENNMHKDPEIGRSLIPPF